MTDRPGADREPLSDPVTPHEPWWLSDSERDADDVHIYGPDGDPVATCHGNLGRGITAWEFAQDILGARAVAADTLSKAFDAARAHPDEAGLRAEIADLLPDLDANYDARYRQGYERARTLVRDAVARAALAQPAVPVAGAEDIVFEAGVHPVHECPWCKRMHPYDVDSAALRAAQPEDDGLDRSTAPATEEPTPAEWRAAGWDPPVSTEEAASRKSRGIDPRSTAPATGPGLDVTRDDWGTRDWTAEPPAHGDHPLDSYLYDGCPGCAALRTATEARSGVDDVGERIEWSSAFYCGRDARFCQVPVGPHRAAALATTQPERRDAGEQ